MNLKYKSGLYFSMLCLLVLSACSTASEYETMVKKGLASGEQHNEIFLGLELGMTSKDFYSVCWEMNKEKLIRQGPSNLSVQYELKDFRQAAVMNFYPTYHNDKIMEMPVEFNYIAWAPWNKETTNDKLLEDVLVLFKKWYGDDFISVKNPNGEGELFVDVDGNRRIIVEILEFQYKVRATITDMIAEQEKNGMIKGISQK